MDNLKIEIKVHLKLKETLEKRGINQSQLAQLTGIRPAAISNLSRGFVERLNLDHVQRIAQALKITDINEIITLEQNIEHINPNKLAAQKIIGDNNSYKI